MKSRLIIFLLAITTTLSAQVERPKWEFGGGIRLNYMKLTGGMSGYRSADGYSFDTKYNEIGMDTYSPSFAIALGGRYKKWNLEFGGSKGSYDGNFITTTDIVRDDVQIDSGAVVSGTLDLNMYALSTNFGLIQRKHDLQQYAATSEYARWCDTSKSLCQYAHSQHADSDPRNR